jgi:hypothetical protein
MYKVPCSLNDNDHRFRDNPKAAVPCDHYNI